MSTWSAEFWFRDAVADREVEGAATSDSFEALAVSLIGIAGNALRCDSDPFRTFGETLLRRARPTALTRGHWEYSPPGNPGWCDVTLTCHVADQGLSGSEPSGGMS
ncbi:hypothetical protein ACWEQL_37105 [Kitasatospora sp. NPDC004240]